MTDQTSGCTILDTICVETATSPGVAVAVSGNINCQTDTVQLSGLGSAVGPNYTYSWTTITGTLVPGNEDSLVTDAIAGGWYFFTVTNTVSGCATTDSVEVIVDNMLPTAVASGHFPRLPQQHGIAERRRFFHQFQHRLPMV